MALKEYNAKRDFTRTAEPKGTTVKPRSAKAMFVIQKHDASRLHYDFRLEMDGVLKSWAVPKGVPTEKGEKRLAVHVEDHPNDYAQFEGIIPPGQYGGGTVMVWDIGTYQVFGDDPQHWLEKEGKLHFELQGKKLHGEWTLIRIRRTEEDNQWLLLKSGDSVAAISRKKDDESVITGRTMKQIAADKDAEWQSNRSPQATGSKPKTSRPPKERTGAAPKFVEPMKAKLVVRAPEGSGWIYELKFDGYRALMLKNGTEVQLLSRNQKDLTGKFPELIEPLRALPVEHAIIDGEIVALDGEGRSSFQLLQGHDLGERPPICYYAFDLINFDGEDLRAQSLIERKEQLQKVVGTQRDNLVRFSPGLDGDPQEILAQIRARGLEGLIAKRRDSRYESGQRSGAWVKLKIATEQEFVIGGYTPPQGTRQYFGAILVGYYEGKEFMFAGKVGTGFNTRLLNELHRRFQGLKTGECPFVNLPSQRNGRWGQGITRSQMKQCTWLAPKLVCQVKFTEWTRDANLRHPVFLGVREDKRASQVVRETPA